MSLYWCPTQIEHCRIGPGAPHRFRYKGLTCVLDILPHRGDARSFFPLAWNKPGLLSLWDTDFLRGKSGTVLEKLQAYLTELDISKEWTRIELVTSPRFLGYVFNPVSFFLFYEQDPRKPNLLMAEVNNTFGETHLYVAEADPTNAVRRARKFTAKKEFHVSPFYDREGQYSFTVDRSESALDIRVNLIRENVIVFTSSIKGELQPVSSVSAPRLLALAAARSWWTLPKIVWQATLLRFRRKLPVFSKPAPRSQFTLGRECPTLFERACMAVLNRSLRKLRQGLLHVELPSGARTSFGGDRAAPAAQMRIRDWAFFSRVLFGGDVAFGECYTEQMWDTDDLTAVLNFFAQNVQYFNDRNLLSTKLRQFLNACAHRTRKNTTRGSRANIPAHYDLGNELFGRFLDNRLVYSCAVFRSPNDTLEKAQEHKLQDMIRKARLAEHHHVLEIGSGWGAFAIEAARQTGCRVTTITLSEEQLLHAQEAVRAAGLQDRIQVLLCDYREIEGKYDRIVSIEMLEAVGHQYLVEFFEVCQRLLTDDGVLALQCITVADQNYESYRRSCDWIQKYIFPGGHCPSLTSVCNAAAACSSFVVEHVENIGPNYARTLREWRSRFEARSDELRALGYDERFQRMWRYYLSYCEAGFATRSLGTLQLVLTQPQSETFARCPGYPPTNGASTS
ncbi:MAG: DUF1365 family protein [Bdellovibrionota bacterium]